ncbi:Ankyrin repeat protein 2 [Aphelenchoides besseyi]|nr:Ankyrin repeat protein 2 [Aphelenchoides besseyi]KAI6223303.1 Ankyrin repeat protein 2 [Aphelenchoides besseyi]
MTPPLCLYAADETLLVSRQSVSEMLGKDLNLLNYVILFNEDSGDGFRFGASAVSPKDTYDYEDMDEVCTFVDFGSEEPAELKPPYRKNTRLYLTIRRSNNASYFELTFKVNKSRSGVYALSCKPGNDYLAITCENSKLLISGLINILNTAEYLMMITEQRQGRCVVCYDRPATIILTNCNHVVFCEECDPENTKCPICLVESDESVSVNKQSIYCMGCMHKKCESIQAFYWPCRCMCTCWESSKGMTICPLCSAPIQASRQVYVT